MEAEKIICCDGARNNDAMAMMAAMNGGMGGGWNNPFAYMMMMGIFRYMYGDNFNNNCNGPVQAQIDSLRNQMGDNHNNDLLMSAVQGNAQDMKTLAANLNCDFNALQNSICGIQAAIQQVGGQVGFSAERVINAANLGDLNIVQQLKDCCCQTQQNVIKMGYESQLGQKDVVNQMQQGFSYTNTGLERGFANIGFQMSQMACDLKNNANANTQRIVDTMNNHWQMELQQKYQDARLELSQQRQNATLIAALRTTPAATPTA